MERLTERRRQLYEALARLRGIEGKTFDECAQQMRVSARTLKRWSSTPEFQVYLRELRDEWSAQATTAVKGIVGEVIQGLRQLARGARSEHVRYEALAKLGDWAGMGQQKVEQDEDDRAALIDLYRIIEESKQPVVNVQLPPGSLIHTPRALPPGDVVDGQLA